MPYDHGRRQTADQAGMIPIPPEELAGWVGRPIHLGWAWVGAQWILLAVQEGKLLLRRPTTRRNRVDRIEAAHWARKTRRG